MTTIGTRSPIHQEHQKTSNRKEEPEEHAIFQRLMMESLDHPERCEEILGIFFEQMDGLIEACSKTQERILSKRLKVAAKSLNCIHDAFADGDENQKALIKNHEEHIEAISQAALECITSIPKEKHIPTPLIEQPVKKETKPLQQERKQEKEPSLKFLIATALQKNDDDAVLSYIAKGAPLKLLSQDDKDRLAEKAALSLNDSALATLIRSGCRIFNPAGQSPILLDAVSNNLIESVNALIERHANLHTTDTQGNTALHRSFFLGNPCMTRLLAHHIDPQSMNSFGQTPLKALFNVHPDNMDYLQLPESRVPLFLEELFKRNPTDLPGGRVLKTPATELLLKISGGKIPPVPIDIVEMTFLAHDPDLNAALFREIDTETFLTACSHLEKSYPKESIARFMTTPYAINEFHYTMGGQSAPVRPLGAKNPPLESFISLFKNLNLYDPGAPHYVDATTWWRDSSPTKEVLSRDEAIGRIQQDLEKGLGRIIHRERYAAVPAFEPEKWFNRIELLLKNIILALQENDNPTTTLNTLKELRSGFQYCATATTTSVITLYEQLCFNVDPSQPHLAFLRPAANFRRQCFDDAVNHIHNAEIHHGHKALVILGPELGLPGHEEAALYQDPVYNGDCRPQEVKQDFARRYSPQSIIDWLLQALKANIDNIRSPYIDLQKLFINPHWDQIRYSKILEQLSAIEKEGNAGKRETAIDALLKRSDIMKNNKDQPPREAIEEDRMADYLGHFVYDEEGQFRTHAAVYLLSCMGVIRSELR